MITELKNKFINANKDKKQVLKEILAEKDTNNFGGFYDSYIAYNIRLKVFAIYKRFSYEDIQKIELYFNEFADELIEEALEQYEINHTIKNGEKFIALHFHKALGDKKYE
ncbi:MAG TPA: hypothetical protein PL131_09510 [Methylotenera sp.]|nr:hypothetical protein [Methylotenera sp.]HPH06099.1 hypothetical protein [Methylotenera sp.]